MGSKETSLQGFNELGNFNPKTDIGAWVHMDEAWMTKLRTELEGFEGNGFKLNDNALVLDVPRELLSDRKIWDERIAEYLDPLRASVGEIGEGVGVVELFPCLVGREEKPFAVVFFSTKLNRPMDPKYTDFSLMYVMPTRFFMQDRPSGWGMKDRLPKYTGGSLGMPELRDILG